MPPKNALEQLGGFVAGHAPEPRAVAKARSHVADTIGAWIAAAGTFEGRALVAYRQPGAPLIDQVATRCAIVRLSEIDDIHLGAMITPGAIVVPAALTVAASLPKVEAQEVAAALVAGYEAMIRLGFAIDGPSVLYRGIWPSYFAAPLGAAAVAARLMRLDEKQMAHALALALIMAAPGVGHHAAATTARWLAIGEAAGRAALAAQAAFTCDLNLADGEFLKNIYGITASAALLGRGWGEPALAQVSFKPWCAARQTMAATQSLKELLAEGLAASSITAIEAAVLPPHRRMIDHGVTAGDRFSRLTSLPYQMAVAALMPDAACDLAAPAGPISPDLAAFMARIMARITVRADDALLAAGYPNIWAARVAVTAGSRRHERMVTHLPGDPARPFSETELLSKFSRVTRHLLADDQAGAMFERARAALDQPAALLHEIERICARQAGRPRSPP